jgi:hypothetical protein
VIAVWGKRAVGEAHSVLPILIIAAALIPKLLPMTVTSPPRVGLGLDTEATKGASYLKESVVPEAVPTATSTTSPVAAPNANAPSLHDILVRVTTG